MIPGVKLTMRANPDKFQFIIFGKAIATPLDLRTGIMLQPTSCLKIFGLITVVALF